MHGTSPLFRGLSQNLVFARQMAAFYLGQNGLVTLRVSLEAIRRPELLASVQEQGSASILAARAIVHRGIGRGELPEGTSATLVTESGLSGLPVLLFKPAIQ